MKKWMWYTIGTILIVGLVGGFFANHLINASTYKNSLQDGRTELKNKQYNAAQTDFQRAAKIKPDSMEANNLLSQTSKFVDAENKFKDYDFSGASDGFNDVINYNQGSSVLKDRAKVELKVLKQVSGNVTRLEKIYNQALAQNKAKEFASSNTTLEAIFEDDLASNTFYEGIVKEAKKLKSANDDKVVLSKYKAKKTDTDKKPKVKKAKKTKTTKANKGTSKAIDAITSSVTTTTATADDNQATTSDNNTKSETNNKQSSTNQASTATSSSSNSVSNSSRNSTASNRTSNYQPEAPVEHHTSSNNTSNPAPSDNSSQGNAPSTVPSGNQGNAPTTVTPSN